MLSLDRRNKIVNAEGDWRMILCISELKMKNNEWCSVHFSIAKHGGKQF